MVKIARNISIVMFALAVWLAVASLHPVSAATCTDYVCDCGKDTAGKDIPPKVDLVCQRQRLISPCSPEQAARDNTKCCTLLYCSGDPVKSQIGNKVLNVNFFGVDLRFDEDKQVATLIYVLFSFFLAFVAIALTLLGVYGAFLRSRSATADDAAKASKLLTNAVVGLILIVFALVFAQLIASFLGIGNLDELVDFSGVFNRGF